PVAVDESNTNTSRPGDQMTDVAPDPSPSPAPDGGSGSDPAPEPAPDPGVGWSTGVASAYGGSTDPYTPNPGTTATGAVCDDWSMGVAVPMAWPRYWQYYGRTVEISYGGMTVLATVNDCGYMGGGSRSLDLQPGVWKAFGFSSCNDWGLRTVSYRFL
ncbi:MAG: RlpA-like double-psi beta-barrel domain-containing protein, partial [Gordonibacter urolithinfaciens]